MILQKLAGAAFAVQLLATAIAYAQTADKPSAFVARRAGIALAPASADARAPNALPRIESREQFDTIARIYDAGTPAAMPHALFVIDRASGQTHYVNTARFALHEDFLRGQRLVLNLDHATLESFYFSPTRRFILGTVSFHPELKRWLFEYWDGDQTSPDLLRETAAALGATFFQPLTFKANSTQQERAADASHMEAITQAQIAAQRAYLALNTGKTQGRLRIVGKLDADLPDDIAPTDIVVLSEAPLSLPPVAGVILAQPSTALSHVNLLAKGWGVPNIYLRDAPEQLRDWDGQWVRLQADRNGYRLQKASGPPVRPARPAAALLSPPDTTRPALIPLLRLAEKDAARCGAKAARLGVLEQARQQGRLGDIAPVPDGFCIPYAQFAAFMAQPAAQALIKQTLATERFDQSSAVRRRALEQLRAELVKLPVSDSWTQEWIVRWRGQLAGQGVFVRSSSNAEDLSNFSGAGLYTTVPNVTDAQALAQAVKTVWASVYNAEAFAARRAARLPHERVQMAVFVQTAVAARTAGVMITRDPFDPSRQHVVYISAKRGLGVRVVDGQRIAEQALYDAWSHAIQRFSRSGEVTELQLDENGGLKEIPTDPVSDVLNDAQILLLARTALLVKAVLDDRSGQDIEWAFAADGRVVLLQARPYIDARAQR
ncbi:MAG: PEP/pyruvate-binding domain-containing protein [Desulfobulbus sp.]|nr:PEP/pyruvate-binding domain-containing protein [Desulfobulbus sp.]